MILGSHQIGCFLHKLMIIIRETVIFMLALIRTICQRYCPLHVSWHIFCLTFSLPYMQPFVDNKLHANTLKPTVERYGLPTNFQRMYCINGYIFSKLVHIRVIVLWQLVMTNAIIVCVYLLDITRDTSNF